MLDDLATTSKENQIYTTYSRYDADNNEFSNSQNKTQHQHPKIHIINYNNNNLTHNKSNSETESEASKATTETSTHDQQEVLNRLVSNIDIQIKLDGDEHF